MKNKIKLFFLVISLLSFIVISCGGSDEETTDEPVVSSSSSDTTAPTVVSTVPVDSATGVLLNTPIVVTFSEAMKTSTITTNTTDTTCSGSIQLSSDDFTTCIQMTADPIASNEDKTFTITPNSNLGNGLTFKIKVTTDVKDVAENPLATIYTLVNGFVTIYSQTATSVYLRGFANNGGDWDPGFQMVLTNNHTWSYTFDITTDLDSFKFFTDGANWLGCFSDGTQYNTKDAVWDITSSGTSNYNFNSYVGIHNDVTIYYYDDTQQFKLTWP